MELKKQLLEEIVRHSLQEDIGSGDITTRYSVSPDLKGRAVIVAKEDMIVCGLGLVKMVFRQVDKGLKFFAHSAEGKQVKKGRAIAELKGKIASILPAERTALNFLGFMSGIATKTHHFVQAIKGYKAKLLDTRKTIPTLRALEKYAVRTGGGGNHRFGLWDGIILKENHLASLGIKGRRGDIDQLTLRHLIANLKKATGKPVEIEAESLAEFLAFAPLGADIILLDNFTPARIRKAVEVRNRRFPRLKLEASGRINIGNIRKVAAAGVDFISSGSLTHSFSSCDVSLELVV